MRNGADIAPGEPNAERDDYGQIVLLSRLRDALARLNLALPADALSDTLRELTRTDGADLIARNRALHRLLVDGVTVEYRDSSGAIRGAQARVPDFDNVDQRRSTSFVRRRARSEPCVQYANARRPSR